MLIHLAILAMLSLVTRLLGGSYLPGDNAAADNPVVTFAAYRADDEKKPQEQADKEAQPPTADELLTKLEKAGDNLHDLTAKVLYLKSDALVGDEQRREGRLYFRVLRGKKNGKSTMQRQFAIEFTRRWIDDREESDNRVYIFDGHWFVEKLPAEKQIFKREVVAPGQTFDPMAIGEGPFPIPIGQKKSEILANYTARVIAPGEGSLEDHTWHLQLVRKDEAKARLKVAQLDLWYLRQNLLPVQAEALDDAGNLTRINLAKIRQNVKPGDEHFDTTVPAEGWDVQITRWEDRRG